MRWAHRSSCLRFSRAICALPAWPRGCSNTEPRAVQERRHGAAQSCREIDTWRKNLMSYAPASLPRNLFKIALREGQRQIGLWSGLCSNIASEIIAGAGFDWIVIDTEHAPNEVPGLLSQLQAMSNGTAEPVVRCAWNDAVMIKRILDVGARSLLVPFVQNAEEARSAVAATRYPPRGTRGVSVAPRANLYGRIADYHRTAHEQTCVLVQVETRAALSEIEA